MCNSSFTFCSQSRYQTPYPKGESAHIAYRETLQLAWGFLSANWRWCGGPQGGAGIVESLSLHLSILSNLWSATTQLSSTQPIRFMPLKFANCCVCNCTRLPLLLCTETIVWSVYSCVSLFYACYCTSLIPLPNISIYRQYEAHNNQYARL